MAYLYEDGERIRLTASNFADIRNMTMVGGRPTGNRL